MICIMFNVTIKIDMDTETIDNENYSKINCAKIRRQILKHHKLVRFFLFFIIALFLILIIMATIKPVRSFFQNIFRGPKMVSTFFTNPLYNLPSYNGITNVLFLGVAGQDHDGSNLTDTIINFSLNLKNQNITMVSIPRDIWVKSLENKINAVYTIGENEATGAGVSLIQDAVYEITSMPIHYVAILDFDGFKDLINELGGIEVDVEKSFTDNWYPIKGKENDLCNGDPELKCRYETIAFNAGKQSMDGETALKFSRSRHSDNLEEGTDFARSNRQQKVITAIKNKILSASILLNPVKMNNLKNIGLKYLKIYPNLSDTEMSAFASFAFSFNKSGNEVKTLNMDTGDEENPGFLISPPVEKYGVWVLEPRSGDWQDFQGYLKQKIEN